MFRQVIVLVLLTLTVTPARECARILGIIPTSSFSHQIVYRPLWNELAERGHDLVVITTDPQKNPNSKFREIDISFAYKAWHDLEYVKRMEQFTANPAKMARHLKVSSALLCDQELQHPEIQSLITNRSEHFDLVMVEIFHPLMTIFSVRFNCPFIGLLSLDLMNYFHGDSGNPTHPVVFPDIFAPYHGDMKFWDRLSSTLYNAVMYLNILIPAGEADIIKKHFGDGMPSIRNIMYNFSMIFLNVHPAFYSRPMGPAFLPIGGGTHLTAPKALPQDFEEFIEGAEHGVIYFSLGTNVNSEIIDENHRRIFLDTFRELPQKILWKFDVEYMPYIPPNVKIVNWAPQQDILRHSNVKAFITQGGLQSLEEALFSHVPIVCVPIFADQGRNAARLATKGLAINLKYDELSTETLKDAILEVINNPKYKKNLMKQASLLVDQPMTGSEKAVWWTEYVLRHKGASHLRNPLMDLPFYQYYLLDVFGFLLAVIFISLWISNYVISLGYISVKTLMMKPDKNDKNIKLK